jgi:hypothetical protein
MDPLPTLNKVFSLVLQEESSNTSFPSILSLVEDNVLVNAYDAKKPQGRGRGSFIKLSSSFCTFCNRHNHTIDFCYQKHGYPNVNKKISHANAASSEALNASNSFGSTGLSQKKMDQLVSLGKLKYFLGLEVAYSKHGISLSKRKHCLNLLSDSGSIQSCLYSFQSIHQASS